MLGMVHTCSCFLVSLRTIIIDNIKIIMIIIIFVILRKFISFKSEARDSDMCYLQIFNFRKINLNDTNRSVFMNINIRKYEHYESSIL